MTDAPERPWIYFFNDPNGEASWSIKELPGCGMTEYIRADIHQAEIDAALDEAIEAALLENNKNNEDWFGVAEGLWIWIINQPGGMNAPMQEGAADAVLENFKEAISAMLREARVEALRKALLMAEGAIVGGQDAYDTYRMIRDLIDKEEEE